ncbi:Ca(2+)-dependent cysteine protease [Haplosporangium sp. Z 767]|nr:Ca(2+)-dependent cysteine protease [Haplosporangium sp. Z 767]KAF9190010.1 Ca(2+)-dependent cysteine protease [Haplosporangium sp. Z 11]
MSSSSFNNDDIDPAILADVARVVQELMRLQQQELQELQPDQLNIYADKSTAVLGAHESALKSNLTNNGDHSHDALDGISAAAHNFDNLKVSSLSVQEKQQLGGSESGRATKDQSSLLSSSTSPSPPSPSSPLSEQPIVDNTTPILISSSTETALLPAIDLEDAANIPQDHKESTAQSFLVPPSTTAIGASTESNNKGSEPDQALINLLPGQMTPIRATTSTKEPAPEHQYFKHPPASKTSSDTANTEDKKDKHSLESSSKPSSAVIPRSIQQSPARPRRKKALLIGINYFGDPNQLLGCINDTRDIFGFLNGYYGFRYQDTIMLTDDQIYEDKRPTGANIRYWMKWLVKDSEPQDSLFFHYAGHGGRIKDFSYNGKTEHIGDEADGYDEIIYPCDYLRSGIISDDEMYDLLVKDLPAGVQLTALVDACHSGTMLDLPYIYNGNHVTALEQVSKTRVKVGAMAAMSSGDFDLPGSNNDGIQTQTTTTTTTTTTTVTMTTTNADGSSPVVTQFTNGSAKTTDGYLSPPGGVPPIRIKDGASSLMTSSQSCPKRSLELGEDADAASEQAKRDDDMGDPEASNEETVLSLAITSNDPQDMDQSQAQSPLSSVCAGHNDPEDASDVANDDNDDDSQSSPRKRSKSVHTIETSGEKSTHTEEVGKDHRSNERDVRAWPEAISTIAIVASVVEKKEPEQLILGEEDDDEKEENMKEARRMALFRETKGNVVMFSGCRDDQASADIRATAKDAAIIANHHKNLAQQGTAIDGTINWGSPKDNGVKEDDPATNPLGYSLPQPFTSPIARGAVSYAWIQCLSQKPEQSYEELLQRMRYFMKQRDLEQIPQLGSGVPMDMRTIFRL